MPSTSIRALNIETFQDLLYIHRCAAERISWIAAHARVYRYRTFHAKKMAICLGLKVDTDMARNCPQNYVSKEPLPEIVVSESPTSPSLSSKQCPQLAPQPKKPTITIPVIGSARRPIAAMLSPSAVWAPALEVVELPYVDDGEWMNEVILTPIESDSSEDFSGPQTPEDSPVLPHMGLPSKRRLSPTTSRELPSKYPFGIRQLAV